MTMENEVRVALYYQRNLLVKLTNNWSWHRFSKFASSYSYVIYRFYVLRLPCFSFRQRKYNGTVKFSANLKLMSCMAFTAFTQYFCGEHGTRPKGCIAQDFNLFRKTGNDPIGCLWFDPCIGQQSAPRRPPPPNRRTRIV